MPLPAFAHEGESDNNTPEVAFASFGPSATGAAYIVLFLIVAVGAFVLLYQYRKK